MGRLESILGGLYLASALLALLHQLGWVVLTGLLAPLSLQALYTLAVAVGWVSGNVFVRRRKLLPEGLRRRFLALYLLGPFCLYALLFSLGPETLHAVSPLVPVYALGVSCVLFLVPYLLRNWPPR
ncbi:MAG: hypothetical protein KDD11_02515 [Acidobacteria bacterium]|nr:hypothetical protein [Acidobacteriota bacterium]